MIKVVQRQRMPHRYLTLLVALASVWLTGVALAQNAVPAFVQQLATAQAGDTITIPAGAFTIRETLKVPAGVTLKGSGFQQTHLTIAAGEGVLLDNVQNVTIADMTVTNKASIAFTVNRAKQIRLQRILVNEGLMAVKISDSDDVIVENSISNACQAAVSLTRSNRVVLANNTFFQCNLTGLSIIDSTECTVINNLLVEVGTGMVVSGQNEKLLVNHNLYKALFIGNYNGQIGRYNLGPWTSVSGLDSLSVQFPVDFMDTAKGDFTPTATLSWDPARHTVSGWGVAKVGAYTAPAQDIYGRPRAGIPDLGAVAVTGGKRTVQYAGSFQITNDAGRKSAGVFTPDGKVVRYLFQDLPLKKDAYQFAMPSYDQHGQPIAPGKYEVRVVEGQLTMKYQALSANHGLENTDDMASNDHISRVAFSPTGDLLLGAGWSERHINLQSLDASYTKKARWNFQGSSDTFGVCTDGKVIYLARWEGKVVLVKLHPETGVPVPWSTDKPLLTFDKLTEKSPNSMAFLNGKLYLADNEQNRLLAGNADQPAFTETLPADAPSSLTADAKRNLLWFISKGQQVVAMRANGAIAYRFTTLKQPLAVAVAGERMAVADAATGKVYIYSITRPQAPKLERTLGTGDGPFGPYHAARFRFQSLNGIPQAGCTLALAEDGKVAVKDRFLSIFAADDKVLHGSFSHFGNAPRRALNPDEKTVRLFDTQGRMSWTVDTTAMSWKADALWHLPEGIGQSIGFFYTGNDFFGVYEATRQYSEQEKETGIAIIRFEKYHGRAVAYYANGLRAKKVVVVHDLNNDGVIDIDDGDGTPLDPQPVFLWGDGRMRYVQQDGSLRMMGKFGDNLGLIWQFKGLDAEKRPIYDWNAANVIPGKLAKYHSTYQPEQLVDFTTNSESAMLPDGGVVVGTVDKFGPKRLTFSNSGTANLVRFTKDGELRWFRPLNDYEPIQGVKSLGNFILTSWGHQTEWIGLDPDGLTLGHLGFPEAGNWAGYWVDHPDQYYAYEGDNGTVHLSVGDYVRNGQHWLVLEGAHDYVKQVFPLDITAQSFLPETEKKQGYTILARADQPRLTIKKLNAPLPIDGDMEKWRTAVPAPQIVILPNSGKGITGPEDTSAVVRMGYESNNLYFQVIRFDDIITLHQTWEKGYLQDNVEMMINGFLSGFQFCVSRYTDTGDSMARRRFYFQNLHMVMPKEHCPVNIQLFDSAKEVPERSIIEGLYGVDLSNCKVMVTEYKIPIDEITYQGDTKAIFPVESGKTVWIGFMIDDNDTPGADYQNYCFWPSTYSTFAEAEASALCTFE